MAGESALRRDVDHVMAELRYIKRSEAKPYRYTYEPPPGVAKEVGEVDSRTLRIWSGWGEASRLTLDTQGFAIQEHPTRFWDFWNEEAVKRDYYPEMEAVVLAHTGARRAIAFDLNVRHAPSAEQPISFLGRPARLVHNDYTELSGPQRLRDLLGSVKSLDVLKHRFAFINLWRPIRGPLRDAPLALCDARSVAPEDLVTSDLVYPDRRGEIYRLAFNPQHRWLYFPDMEVGELVFIKCYDSMNDGRARFSAHSAFDDPTCPPGAAPRQSVEVRTLVLW